jgi:transcriptional regulator GlxA family with amidase domain
MDPRVEKIEQLMRENVHREWSLPGLAQAVNLSVWRVCHIFRSEVGKSPIEYLRQLRMHRAKYLLETSFLSVKQIAHQIGVKDESHFVRDFKKAYGASPTLYRMRSHDSQAKGAHN